MLLITDNICIPVLQDTNLTVFLARVRKHGKRKKLAFSSQPRSLLPVYNFKTDIIHKYFVYPEFFLHFSFNNSFSTNLCLYLQLRLMSWQKNAMYDQYQGFEHRNNWTMLSFITAFHNISSLGYFFQSLQPVVAE